MSATWNDPGDAKADAWANPTEPTNGDSWGNVNEDVSTPVPAKKSESSYSTPRKGFKKTVTLADLTKDGLKGFPFEHEEEGHAYEVAEESPTFASLIGSSVGPVPVSWDFPAAPRQSEQPTTPLTMPTTIYAASSPETEIITERPQQISQPETPKNGNTSVSGKEDLAEHAKAEFKTPKLGNAINDSTRQLSHVTNGKDHGVKTGLKPDAGEFVPSKPLSSKDGLAHQTLYSQKVLLDSHFAKLSATGKSPEPIVDIVKVFIDDYFKQLAVNGN